MHTQQRDNSGLYPLTIKFSGNCNTLPFLSISKKGGGVSEKARIFYSLHGLGVGRVRQNQNKIWVFHIFTHSPHNKKQNTKTTRGPSQNFASGRAPPSTPDIGGKAIRRCAIPGLVVPKAPYRREACIYGKMHHMGQWRPLVGLQFRSASLKKKFRGVQGGPRAVGPDRP